MTGSGGDRRTVVHLVRHGEVENLDGVLYGRLPGYHLSELGRAMALRLCAALADRDVAAVLASPLERAQETAAPLAERLGLDIGTDDRLTEALSVFEGRRFGAGGESLRSPAVARHLVNPFRPSWGEPYVTVAARMRAAVAAARDAAAGREIVCVSHQLPIEIARRQAEGRRLWHDPRSRRCTLASVTTFTYSGTALVGVGYTEPVRDLLPVRRGRRFVAGA